MGYTGKYLPLKEYLKSSTKIQEELSFKDIESILKSWLPPSAYDHKGAWWSNNNHRHTQSNSWLEAGWIVGKVELPNKVVFIKTTT